MQNKKDEKNEENEPSQRVPFSITPFLSPKLFGFHLAFVAMIFIPLLTLFGTKVICHKLEYTKKKTDTLALIFAAISIWIIMVSYAIYYGWSDIKKVYNSSKDDNSTEKKTQ